MLNLVKSKNFTTYLFGLTISNIGDCLMSLVLPLLVLDLTHSSMQLFIVTALDFLPYAVIGLPFGAVANRLNLKIVMQVCDFIRFISYMLLCISFIILPKEVTIFLIYLISLISGTCYVFHSISEGTIIPKIVEKNDLALANSLIYGSQYLTSLIMPAIGGYLYTKINTGYFFLIDSFTFIVNVAILFFVKGNFDPIIKDKIKIKVNTIYKEVINGFKILLMDKKITCILILVTIDNLVIVSYYNYLLIYFRDIVNINSEKIGFILGIVSIGSFIGATITSYISKKISANRIVILTLLIDAVCRIIIPFSQNMIFLVFILIITELVQSILNIIVITIRQSEIKEKDLGMVNSVFKTIIFSIRPIGLLIGGTLSVNLGIINTLIFTGCICVILFIYSILSLRKE